MKTAIPVLILTILLTTNGLCDTNSMTAADHLLEGAEKFSNGDYNGAIKAYDKAIALDPKFALVYFNRGFAKAELKQYFDAIADFDKAIALDPKYALAYINRGVAKANLKQYHAAITDYNKAIALDPKYVPAYFNRGVAKADLNQYFDAIADYDKAIALDPKYALAYINRGFAKASGMPAGFGLDDVKQIGVSLLQVLEGPDVRFAEKLRHPLGLREVHQGRGSIAGVR